MPFDAVQDLVIMPTIARALPHAPVHNGLSMLTPPGITLMLSHQSLHSSPV